jgi:hypothetical protein
VVIKRKPGNGTYLKQMKQIKIRDKPPVLRWRGSIPEIIYSANGYELMNLMIGCRSGNKGVKGKLI